MKKYTLAREVNKALHAAKGAVSLSALCRRKELKKITKYNENIFNACVQLVSLGVAKVSLGGGYEAKTNALKRGASHGEKRQVRYLCYL